MGDETGPSPAEMGLSEQDRQAAGLSPEQDGKDPRQQIDELNTRLRDHYRGHWEAGAPDNPEARRQILDKELADYETLTGFSVGQKIHLENLRERDSRRKYGPKHIRYNVSDVQREDSIRALERSEKAAIEQKLSGASRT